MATTSRRSAIALSRRPELSAALALTGPRRAALRRRLLAWWDAGHRALPWRFTQHGADPYRVWLAEAMLQQTQVAAALPYFRRFVERFPSLEVLAAASEEEVLALWSGLGYYARGRRLHEAATVALARHGGLPRSAAELARLPGFGPYTAGAVASIAFAEPVPCVDGNVARVLSRLALVERAPEEPAARRALWALAGALVPAERPGDWNQAVMELGATLCVKPAPRCERCPVERLCAARAAGREREVPLARRRRPLRALQLACAWVERGGRLLVVRRPPGGLFGGLWSLPAATVPEGEDPLALLARALPPPLFLSPEGPALASVERLLSHRRLALTAWRCELAGEPDAGAGHRWAPLDRLVQEPLPTAMRRLAESALAAAAGASCPRQAGGRSGSSAGACWARRARRTGRGGKACWRGALRRTRVISRSETLANGRTSCRGMRLTGRSTQRGG